MRALARLHTRLIHIKREIGSQIKNAHIRALVISRGDFPFTQCIMHMKVLWLPTTLRIEAIHLTDVPADDPLILVGLVLTRLHVAQGSAMASNVISLCTDAGSCLHQQQRLVFSPRSLCYAVPNIRCPLNSVESRLLFGSRIAHPKEHRRHYCKRDWNESDLDFSAPKPTSSPYSKRYKLCSIQDMADHRDSSLPATRPSS